MKIAPHLRRLSALVRWAQLDESAMHQRELPRLQRGLSLVRTLRRTGFSHAGRHTQFHEFIA
jgi:hypothetical protein